MEFDKKFVIIGNQSNVIYKEVFRFIKNNKLWLGSCLSFCEFRVPDYYEERSTRFRIDENGVKWRSFGNICWFTNLEIPKRNEIFETIATYEQNKYIKYDNYNAINIDKASEIPMDYDDIMGVPVTFLNKHNPKQFEIIGMSASAGYDKEIVGIDFMGEKDARPIINGKVKFARIFIKNKNPRKAKK